ncbi:YbaN family protein [Enterococcus timonensis]|uniref:YbaN family protein n=1 Tax=Enterococcus timonensis TaxID=1852364 RepID=UPI0008D8FFBE|nr:YbaN family protein [Enterococcus timonensis]
MKKYLYIALGGIFFTLGTLGIFLPILPTTGFYLLTGFFWIRSSEKLHQRFVTSPHYQKYVEKPFLQKQMTTKSMIKMFFVMGLVFLIPILLVDFTWLRWLLVGIYAGHVVGLSLYLKGKIFRKVPVTAEKPLD